MQDKRHALAAVAAEKLAAVAGKTVPIETRVRGSRTKTTIRHEPAEHYALVGVAPADVLWLCERARPANDEDKQKVLDLQHGCQTANGQLDEVYILAKDLVLLVTLAAPPITPPAAPPADTGAAGDDRSINVADDDETA